MKNSLLTALTLAFALAVTMPILGVSNANAAMGPAPAGMAPAGTTATDSPSASEVMATKYVKKHVKKHKKHVKKHTMAKKAY